MECKVKWEGSENEVVVDADTAENAYLKFLEDAHPEDKPVVVSFSSSLGSGNVNKVFTDHLDGATPSFYERKKFESLEVRLERIYDVLNHMRWIGLGIGGMFALTFIVPQCTGG